jgi:hypothetical protein
MNDDRHVDTNDDDALRRSICMMENLNIVQWQFSTRAFFLIFSLSVELKIHLFLVWIFFVLLFLRCK